MKESGSLRLYNMQGALIYNESIAGSQFLSTFDLKEYPTGVYMLELELDGVKMAAQQIIKE